MYIPKTVTFVCETPSPEVERMQIEEVAKLAKRVLVDEPKAANPSKPQSSDEGR